MTEVSKLMHELFDLLGVIVSLTLAHAGGIVSHPAADTDDEQLSLSIAIGHLEEAIKALRN